jgi:hypothetical protein
VCPIAAVGAIGDGEAAASRTRAARPISTARARCSNAASTSGDASRSSGDLTACRKTDAGTRRGVAHEITPRSTITARPAARDCCMCTERDGLNDSAARSRKSSSVQGMSGYLGSERTMSSSTGSVYSDEIEEIDGSDDRDTDVHKVVGCPVEHQPVQCECQFRVCVGRYTLSLHSQSHRNLPQPNWDPETRNDRRKQSRTRDRH